MGKKVHGFIMIGSQIESMGNTIKESKWSKQHTKDNGDPFS